MFARRASRTRDGQRAKRRREGRGLGPFTSGHLTIIVVTLVIVVAFPFAAFAVTGNNVFVTDATSGVRAKVDAKKKAEENERMAALYRQHVLKEEPAGPVLQIQGLGGKKKAPVQEVLHKDPQ